MAAWELFVTDVPLSNLAETFLLVHDSVTMRMKHASPQLSVLAASCHRRTFKECCLHSSENFGTLNDIPDGTSSVANVELNGDMNKTCKL
jgi:hypothetical protein